ncbi:MAG TPA: hypothetical protein VGD71_31485 [Kribbella sp.]
MAEPVAGLLAAVAVLWLDMSIGTVLAQEARSALWVSAIGAICAAFLRIQLRSFLLI